MEIRKIRKAEMATALQLIWETFLQFEAPDYSQQGIDSFYEFISNQGIIDSLEFFGAFDNNTLRGVLPQMITESIFVVSLFLPFTKSKV